MKTAYLVLLVLVLLGHAGLWARVQACQGWTKACPNCEIYDLKGYYFQMGATTCDNLDYDGSDGQVAVRNTLGLAPPPPLYPAPCTEPPPPHPAPGS